MNKKQNIPVFSVDFTDDSIWNSISIVDFPAVEENFIKLAKQSEVKFSIDGERGRYPVLQSSLTRRFTGMMSVGNTTSSSPRMLSRKWQSSSSPVGPRIMVM